MATEYKVLDVSWVAAEDLSNDQYRIVTLAAGLVQRPDAVGDVPLGVLQNAPRAGEAAVVRLIGVSKIRLGEVMAANEYIKLEFNDAADAGKAIHANVALDLTIGRCLIGGAEDELGEILLSGAVHQVAIAT